MSLFSRLLKLNTSSVPLEDFFTEIVAYLFSTNKAILYAWLEHLNLLNTNSYLDAQISTHRTFAPLYFHLMGSRPDILIELQDENYRDIIFIESKVGSQEGHLQLSRYAEILHTLKGFRHKILIYITRDFEPKEQSVIFKTIPESEVKFKQLRWYEFYHFLRSLEETMLIQEIKTFMQEYSMASNNQFSSIDILTLGNMPKAMKLMDETMGSKVSQRFQEIMNPIKPQYKRNEIQIYERYIKQAWIENGKWWVGLGFFLNTSNVTDYPRVCLLIEVASNSRHRAEIVDAMKDICSQFRWQAYHLDNSPEWPRIVRQKSLREFLSQDDHVAAIQEFFMEALDELEQIKRQYPTLPWGGVFESDKNLEDDLIEQSEYF